MAIDRRIQKRNEWSYQEEVSEDRREEERLREKKEGGSQR